MFESTAYFIMPWNRLQMPTALFIHAWKYGTFVRILGTFLISWCREIHFIRCFVLWLLSWKFWNHQKLIKKTLISYLHTNMCISRMSTVSMAYDAYDILISGNSCTITIVFKTCEEKSKHTHKTCNDYPIVGLSSFTYFVICAGYCSVFKLYPLADWLL